MGFEVLALLLVKVTDAYLRPGEALSMKAQDVIAVHPQPGGGLAFVSLRLATFEDSQPTRTGDYNDSVIFNAAGRGRIGELLLKLAQTLHVERLQKVMSGKAEPIQSRPCHHR